MKISVKVFKKVKHCWKNFKKYGKNKKNFTMFITSAVIYNTGTVI